MKELYIDDVLMDIAPDTDISLTIKSNAFSDLKQMASNSSYTIRLPKTTKNESVLMSVARVQNGGAWARTRHTARYIVDGVPIIEDGLVTLLSIGEDFEISIVWGIYPNVADIVDNDMSLRDLTSQATILFDVYNVPENYSTAMGRGYFYADYIPIQVVEYTGWLDFASVLDYTLPTITATFENGQILTGEVGETLSMAVLPTTGRRCAVLDFWLGSTAVLANLSGLADSISWVVTDELFRVLLTGDQNTSILTIDAPTRSAHLILNTDSSQGSCNIYPLVRNNPTASIDLNSFGGAADHARYKYAKYIHPCVSVKWLLEQIELDKGVAFKWDGAERTFIESLVLPLTTEDANAATTQQNGFEATFERTTSLGLQTAKVTKASPLVQEAQGTSSTTLHITNDCSVVIDVQLRYYHDVSGVTPVAGSYGFFYRNFLDVIVTNNGNDTTYSIGINGSGNIPSRYGNDGNLYHIIAGTGELSLAQGDTIKFDLKNNGGGLAGMEVNGGAITITENSIGKTPRGGQFPIVTNLPDIKVNDFIKYLCAVTATYPKQVNGKGEVTFATLSSMYDPSISTEWSSKTNAILLPDETTYNLNNWARKNLWKYKEDERTKGNYDGTLTIANDTLDAENNVAEFPFAASDKNVVPLYERQQKFGTYNTDATEGDNSGSLNLTGCEPRIMVGYDNSNIISLTFDGLEMQGIIDNKYNLLSGALADMTIIKVKVALSVVDIHELDETKPIYIRQFASYFALLQLEVNFGGMSTATLMRLKA